MLPSSIFAELAADEGKCKMAEIPLDNREMEKQVESVPRPSKIAGLWPEVTAAGGVGYYHEQEKLDEVDSPVALDITSHSNDPDLPTFTPKVAFPAALAINSPSTDPEMPTFTPRTLL